ncbi:DNA-binding protein RFX2 isoform X3 [Culex pipiens pallens]|uniref:DNA-binding protein RFX2 isoform X3 n=1 Tax=Culex pipiens pallens TaxID=42434 RepID=UPI001953C3FA|nr:DNA-binding protein RFX2 isoform X3 [Culex pipiens pallens]
MSARLATQRSFITVTPIPAPSTPTSAVPASASSSPVAATTITAIDPGSLSDPDCGGSPSSSVGTPTATITIPAGIGTSTIKSAGAADSNSAIKTNLQSAVSVATPSANPAPVPTSLIANNLSIANLLGTQAGTLTLQQIIQQQKKIVIHPNGTVIDILPIDDSDSADDSKIDVQLAAADGEGTTVNGQQQVTAQVAVVQAQSPTDGGPQYITVTATAAAVDPNGVDDDDNEDDEIPSYAAMTTVDVSSPDNVQNHHTYVQYVDSDMYTTNGHSQTQMAYPVYTVGDYSASGGQQYYTTGGNGSGGNTSNGPTSGTPGNGNYATSPGGGSHPGSNGASANGTPGGGATTGNGSTPNGGAAAGGAGGYIVPVDEATLLGTAATTNGHQRDSPQAMTVAWLVENYENAEGVSLPRSTLYNHYMRHCNEHKLDAVNAASFGKLIRSVFTGLRTRRLGTRGNSKYHYYGIRIKPGSVLNNSPIVEDGKPLNASHVNNNNNNNNSHNHNTMGGANGGGGGGMGHGGMAMNHRGSRKGMVKNDIPESCGQYLGDPTGAIPEFPLISLNHPFAEEITLEDVDTLRSIYREHCEAFLDAIVNLDFNTIESLWREFWRADNINNNGDECEEERYLSKSKLYLLTQCEPIQTFIKQVDFMFYQNMVDVLIPDVLRPIPTGLTQAIRNFAKNLENWLSSAMSGCPKEIVKIKLSAVSAFGQTLRRYTSLNHLAQAARAVLQNSTQIAQMLNDLNRVDFRNVQEQASWICQCDTAKVQRLENDFKAALQQQNSLEQWASWLRAVVDDALEEFRDKPSFVNAARQFLLKWSFYSSMVIRDLTLRSAGSFGSFHLIRLLYDEYMFFIIEHKVAKATHKTPIAVMGERDNGQLHQLSTLASTHQQQQQPHHPDDVASMLYTSDFEVVNVKMEPSAKRMRS